MIYLKKPYLITLFLILALPAALQAQQISKTAGGLTVKAKQASVSVNTKTGSVSYRFSNGVLLDNTTAYINDLGMGYMATGQCAVHRVNTSTFTGPTGKGTRIIIQHSGNPAGIVLTQQVTVYSDRPYILTRLTATRPGANTELESRDVCALAVMPKSNGKLYQPGTEPRFLDVPFDNDDWTHVLERNWHEATGTPFDGISYEYAAIYDNTKLSGLVMGSLSHDFWKTGIYYHSGTQTGLIDSLKIADGVATPDNPKMKADYGGNDGTHDHMQHGTMKGHSITSSVIYLCGLPDVRKAFVEYGNANVLLNGRQTWKGAAPVYWNSFGVEGVLGYSHVMMPPDVMKISDFIRSLDNFNRYSKPVVSIDSYDQSIYNTDVLRGFGRYAAKNGQQLGFYFIPFAMWTWKNGLKTTKIAGADYSMADVVLRDADNQPIWYKDGDWGALAMDPTHPAVRAYIINQLEKAKTIGAKFIKIDFLTAGALESSRRFNPNIRSGLQAYNYGMKMLWGLVDSIMGKDVFITQAISPMFPHQYAHTRFNSTDVYSHLRDDQPGFPNWGSTEASLAAGSHQWWAQGTLWPYTNMDVSIMKNFQKNPELTDQEIRVRLFAMMAMGSILGDGSDFRDKVAAGRAKIYLNNKNLCRFFSSPRAFTPLKFADGTTFDQQIAFYLPGKTPLLSQFNFDLKKEFNQEWTRNDLGLDDKEYTIVDFLTDRPVGKVTKGRQRFSIKVGTGDAVMVKLVPVN